MRDRGSNADMVGDDSFATAEQERVHGEFLTGFEYLEVLTRRWWFIATSMAIALAAALFISASMTPMYRASAEVLVNQQSASDVFDPNTTARGNTSVLTRQTVNEARFIESDIVRLAAEEHLGFDAKIDALTDSKSDIITLRAEAADPRVAQTTARVFAETYLSERRQRYIDDFVLASGDVQERIDRIDDQLRDLPDDSEQDRNRLGELKLNLIESRDQLSIAADLASGGGGQIIGLPELPAKPFSPQTTRNIVFAVVAGLAVGIAAALTREALDQSIGSPRDLETISGVSSLALIPTKPRALRAADIVVSLTESESEAAEAYRTLRASLQFMTIDHDAHVLQVTSPNPGEGKTTTSANLAVAMAMTGRSAVIVDADLRKPKLHERFGTSQEPGLTNVVLGDCSVRQAKRSVDGTSGALALVPSGPIPPLPSELLSHKSAHDAIQDLREAFDVVIIDSPPVLPVADALVISRLVDATVLVVNARSTRRGDVSRAMELLRKVEAPVVGTVLNEVRGRRWFGGYGYGYGYDSKDGNANRVTSRRDKAAGKDAASIEMSESVERVLRQPHLRNSPEVPGSVSSVRKTRSSVRAKAGRDKATDPKARRVSQDRDETADDSRLLGDRSIGWLKSDLADTDA